MEPSASWLDLDMAGMLVANFLQSWLQASLAPQPHPQQIAHDIQDSIPPSPEDGLCLSASIDDGTGASSPGEHGQAICPQGQSPEPRLAERQDPCAGSRLRLLRHPDQQSRRFQDVGGRCFSGKSRRGLRVGSLSPVRAPAAIGTGCWRFAPSPALCTSTRTAATIQPTSTINFYSDSKEPCPKPSFISFARASRAANAIKPSAENCVSPYRSDTSMERNRAAC